MKKLYWFYRREQIWTLNLWQVSLNWWYTISFFANWQYADWVNAWLISIKDQEIPENRYTKEIIPWIKDLREFIYLEYNENVVDILLTTNIIKKIGARFDLELFDDIEQAKTFIREHTNLVEETPWYFILSEETIWINWEIIPKKYLIID
jgi:hypothetical protein